MKQVIHIYGASGSGTSTLGKKLCEETGYRFMDTDDYFWMPTDPRYTQKRPKAERIALMKKDIKAASNVVISGSLVDWGDELISYFTLAVRLETSTDVRIARIRKREFLKFGKRIEPGGDMYQQHQDFVKWAEKYDNGDIYMRSKAKHDEWQKLLLCPQIILNGEQGIAENCLRIKEELEWCDLTVKVMQGMKQLMENDCSVHDFWHSIRVYQTAILEILKEKSFRMQIVWMP